MRRQPAPAYLGAVSQLPQSAPPPGGLVGPNGMQMVSMPGTMPGYFPEDADRSYPEGVTDSTTARVVGTALILTALVAVLYPYTRSS